MPSGRSAAQRRVRGLGDGRCAPGLRDRVPPSAAPLPLAPRDAVFTARSVARTLASSSTAVAGRARLVAAHQRPFALAFAHHAEVDLAAVQVDAADLHPHARAHGVADAGALAAQFLARFVEAVVLAAEFGDVHQALDIQRVQRHEEAEARHRAHRAGEFLAQVLAHVAALEPGLDVAAGLVGAALVGAAVRAHRLPTAPSPATAAWPGAAPPCRRGAASGTRVCSLGARW